MSEQFGRVQIDPGMRPKIKEFEFDEDMFGNACRDLNIPDMLFDGLTVHLKKGEYPADVTFGGINFGSLGPNYILASYHVLKNKIDIFPTHIRNNLQDGAKLPGAWQNQGFTDQLSAFHCSALAHETMHVRGMNCTEHGRQIVKVSMQDKVRHEKAKHYADISALVGSVLGIEIAQLSQTPALLDSVASLVAIGGIAHLREYLRRRALNFDPAIQAASQAEEQNACAFQRSQKAVDLFSGVIQIELAKPKRDINEFMGITRQMIEYRKYNNL